MTAAQKPQLRLYRNHAITQASADEDTPLSPVLVAPNQQWTETELGRQVSRTGTILVFDTSAMSLAGKAMVRVRPLLFWDGGGCVLGEREVNIGDIRYAIAWTVAVVVIGLLLVLVLARAKKENPMLLLTGRWDTTVSPGNTSRLVRRICEHGGNARAIFYRGLGHTLVIGALSRPLRYLLPVYSDVTEFLAEH